jgi:hypothetical protein
VVAEFSAVPLSGGARRQVVKGGPEKHLLRMEPGDADRGKRWIASGR